MNDDEERFQLQVLANAGFHILCTEGHKVFFVSQQKLILDQIIETRDEEDDNDDGDDEEDVLKRVTNIIK